MKVCAEPGCPRLQQAAKCDEHGGSTRQARGYDAAYDRQLRTPAYLAATHCATCGCEFTTDNPKTGGHTIPLRDGGKGSPIEPQCRRCNYGWQTSGL